MQNHQETQNNILEELKSFSSKIQGLQTLEDFTLNTDLFSQLYEKASFLKIFNEKFGNSPQIIETETIVSEQKEQLVAHNSIELPELTTETEKLNTTSENYQSETTRIFINEDQNDVNSTNETHQEKKFKLANIKALKPQHSLFEEEFLENVEENDNQEDSQDTFLTNTIINSDKLRPDFRLDFNDRLAFTKNLFADSQDELNQVINKLNSFNTLNDAKEYLSDEYYQRNWKIVDDYAQRLWRLVENKFL